jgi:hypothetical protein
MKKNYLWIILIIVLIGIVVWYYYDNYKKQAIDMDEDENISELIKSDTKFNQADSLDIVADQANYYQNTRYDISLFYPQDWFVSNEDQEAENVEFYSDENMVDGMLISLSFIEDKNPNQDIREWIESFPVGDPEGAQAKKNTKYVIDNEKNILYALTEMTEFGFLAIHWKCQSNIYTLSYTTDRDNYEENLPIFKGIFESITVCK